MTTTETRPRTDLTELTPLLDGIRTAIAAHASWADTAQLVAAQLRRNLPTPDVLSAEQRLGSPDTYQSHTLHAEPDGAPRGYAQSYEKRDATQEASGTLTAPFSGIHGWYWENKTNKPVTLTLQTAGFYNLAHEFTADGVKNKTFD